MNPVMCGCPAVYAGAVVSASGTGMLSLPVAAGQRGDITGMYSTGTGTVNFTVDGSAPSAAPGLSRGRVGSQPLALRDIDLSKFRAAGSAAGSVFAVVYRVRV